MEKRVNGRAGMTLEFAPVFHIKNWATRSTNAHSFLSKPVACYMQSNGYGMTHCPKNTEIRRSVTVGPEIEHMEVDFVGMSHQTFFVIDPVDYIYLQQAGIPIERYPHRRSNNLPNSFC